MRLLSGQNPLSLIEHQEAAVGVVADEGIVAEDPSDGKSRTFGTEFNRPYIYTRLARGADKQGGRNLSTGEENLCRSLTASFRYRHSCRAGHRKFAALPLSGIRTRRRPLNIAVFVGRNRVDCSERPCGPILEQ